MENVWTRTGVSRRKRGMHARTSPSTDSISPSAGTPSPSTDRIPPSMETNSSSTSRTPGRRIEIVLLALIIAGAAAVRFARLGDLPLGAAGSEEGTSWIVTSAQMQHGWPALPSGLAYWKGWPYTLLAALTSS